jgi:hypothetical protein
VDGGGREGCPLRAELRCTFTVEDDLALRFRHVATLMSGACLGMTTVTLIDRSCP